ncbi:MAG: hypothetical protein JEY96_19420 [Bacteroidales bacterium]|nr:hypothetical protein [Bacteroidales bacterium]
MKDIKQKKDIALFLGILLIVIYIINLFYPIYISSLTALALGKITNFILILIIRIYSAFICVSIAKQLNRETLLWGVLGFIIPPIFLIVISQLKAKKESEKELNREELIVRKLKEEHNINDSTINSESGEFEESYFKVVEQLSEEKSEYIKKQVYKEKLVIDQKFHDNNALTDEQIDIDQAGKGANITIQSKISENIVNVPVEVMEVYENEFSYKVEYIRVKFKNGQEDIIHKDHDFILFSNEEDDGYDEDIITSADFETKKK